METDVHPARDDTGYFKLRFNITRESYIDIYERLENGAIIKYCYALVVKKQCRVRYDNAPHHSHISTWPHHKHLGVQILPLPDPSIEAFIDDVRRYLTIS